jgi:hypothetical protein
MTDQYYSTNPFPKRVTPSLEPRIIQAGGREFVEIDGVLKPIESDSSSIPAYPPAAYQPYGPGAYGPGAYGFPGGYPMNPQHSGQPNVIVVNSTTQAAATPPVIVNNNNNNSVSAGGNANGKGVNGQDEVAAKGLMTKECCLQGIHDPRAYIVTEECCCLTETKGWQIQCQECTRWFYLDYSWKVDQPDSVVGKDTANSILNRADNWHDNHKDST